MLGEPLRRRLEASPRYRTIVLVTLLYGLFTVGFTITLIAVSIPRIAGELGTDQYTLGWVLTGPLLVYGLVGPTAGKLGDLLGHRRTYLVALVLDAMFAGLTALSWNAASIISFRVLGAVSGAVAAPASLAIINRVYPSEHRSKAMGFWSLVGAGGPVIGVVAGGPIIEAFGFRAIFWAQVPLMALAFVAAWSVLPSFAGVRKPFDIAGTVLLAAGVTPVLMSLNRGPALGWDHPVVLAGFVVSPLALAAFLRVERRTAHPLIPLRYFRRRNFVAPITVQALTMFAYMGGFFLTPQLLQGVMHYTETRTGFLSIARPLSFAIAGPLAGAAAVRAGERTMGMAGAAAVVVSMLGLSTIAPGSTDLVVVSALALSGIGLGLLAPAMASTMANSVDEADLGVAGATSQMVMQIGTVAGTQLMFTLQQSRAGAVGLVPSYGEAYWLAAAVAAIAVVVASQVRNSRSIAPVSSDAPEPARELETANA